MAQAMPMTARPTYEQLEEMLRRKDKLFKLSWSDMEDMRAILWMTYMAHEGNQKDYDPEEYAITACIVSRFVNRRIRALDDEIGCRHRSVADDVLAGRLDTEEATHG